MTNGYLDTIRELLVNDDTPQRVSNKILFGALMEIYQKMNLDDQFREELIEKVESIGRQLDALERRVKGLEERQVEAPSIVWMLKHDTRETLKTLAIIIFVLIIILALSEPARALLQAISGMP